MKFTDRSLLVIGDLILDEYLHGDSTRISQEAPVPIVRFREFEYRLGGAGNVAANIATLGGSARVIGLLGNDKGSSIFGRLLSSYGVSFVYAGSRRMTIKTRIIANGQQIGRVDTEDVNPVEGDDLKAIVAHIRGTVSESCAVVISDYAKGVITPDVMDTIRSCADSAGIPVFLDPKVSQAEIYRKTESRYPIEVITPNYHEAEGLAGSMYTNLYDMSTSISFKYAAKNVLITRGEDGMTLVSHVPNAPMRSVDIPTAAHEVFDVSGAGDTVIATLALACASGYTIEQAARMANIAAGVAVGKRGTATVSYDELVAAGGSDICIDGTNPVGV